MKTISSTSTSTSSSIWVDGNIATQNLNNYITSISTSPSIWVDDNISTQNLNNYIIFISKILNINIPNYEEFINMSESDKNIYLRDHKINEILK